tara:strand:+ start:227 stop:409 length:183 start_codon:yes stop_codon:yes gene_type:complete
MNSFFEKPRSHGIEKGNWHEKDVSLLRQKYKLSFKDVQRSFEENDFGKGRSHSLFSKPGK